MAMAAIGLSTNLRDLKIWVTNLLLLDLLEWLQLVWLVFYYRILYKFFKLRLSLTFFS